MPAITELTLAERNQKFLDAESKVDTAIQIRKRYRKSTWRSMVPRGTYMLGEGLEKKSYSYWSGLSQQRGLHLWHNVQISRKPSAGDPGYDATVMNPHTVTYGFEAKTYGGMGIEYKTPHISIKDLRFTAMLNQQLRAVYGYLGDFTNDMWENYSREQYARYANVAEKCFVITNGRYSSQRFTYDPESVDSEGDNVAVVDGGGSMPIIGILNWDPIKALTRRLQMQVPMGAIADLDGRPAFGWVGDLEDFDKMIEKDPELREDWRQARDNQLIQNYGKTTVYKGCALMHDTLTPRFDIKSVSGNVITLKRVDPMVASTASLTGERVDVNDEYLYAEFGSFFIYLKDVFMSEVPPSGPMSPGGGTSFGASPGLNGEWKWLNYQTDDNPLMQKGYWFMQAEAFSKPLENSEEAIMVIYRRFTHHTALDTEIGGTAAATEQRLVENPTADDVDSVNNTIAVKLAGFLTAEAGQEITLVDDAGTGTIAGIVLSSDEAPSYILALASTPTFGDYTAAGGAKVTV